MRWGIWARLVWAQAPPTAAPALPVPPPALPHIAPSPLARRPYVRPAAPPAPADPWGGHDEP